MTRAYRFVPAAGTATLAVGLLAGCASMAESAQHSNGPQGHSTSPAATAQAAWAYSGASGPEAWGDLSGQFATCENGDAQSPIDLPADPAQGTAATTVTIHEPLATGKAVDTGHTGEFIPDHEAQTVTYDGVRYELTQLHFHVPAEHTIAGKNFAAEFHFVHRSADGQLLVLALLAEDGEPTPAIQPFVEGATHGTDLVTSIQLSAIVPPNTGAFVYSGSLTTPPCTEHVQWIVLKDTITLSAAQLEQLEGLHGANARPVQPLGDRAVSAGEVTVDQG